MKPLYRFNWNKRDWEQDFWRVYDSVSRCSIKMPAICVLAEINRALYPEGAH